jgi:hypothetical protein
MKQEISATSGDDEENILINTFSFANDSGQLDMDTYGEGGTSGDGDGNGNGDGNDADENDNDLKIAIMEVCLGEYDGIYITHGHWAWGYPA